MSCVRPGVLLTNARRLRPVSALIALDLPALLRPANASSGTPGGGSSCGSCTESAYAASPSARPLPRLAALPRATLESESFRPRGPRMRVFTALAGLMALVYATAIGAAPAEIPAARRPVPGSRGGVAQGIRDGRARERSDGTDRFAPLGRRYQGGRGIRLRAAVERSRQAALLRGSGSRAACARRERSFPSRF